MGNSDDPEEFGEKLVAPADFDGPAKHRHCTDILCLLMLIASWVVMTAIGIYSVSEGDYRLVLYPLDYDGNICGTDYAQDMTDFPNLLYVNAYSGGVCVEECPDLTNLTEDGLTDIHTMITYEGLWQTDRAELEETEFVKIADYSNSTDAIACTEENCFPNLDDPSTSWDSQGVNKGFGYAFYAGSTYWALWRCYLLDAAEARIEELVNATDTVTDSDNYLGLGALDDAYAFWNRLYGDLWTARAYVLGFGFGASLIVSLVYIFLLRLPMLLTAVVWGSIFISIGMFFAGGYYAWNQASEWEDEDPQTVETTTINATSGAAVALWVIGAVLFVLACCLRKSIQLAILCVKQAGKAVNSMMLILCVPLLQAFALALFTFVFCAYAVHLASLGEIKTEEVDLGTVGGQQITYRTYEFDDFVQNCAWYLLFCLFWTANFIVAAGDMIVAIAIAKWYFTRNKATIGSWTVISSVRATAWYHLGTCAFGSLLIAIVQIVRALIARAQKAAKDTENKLAQYLLCCCQCCFWCLEKFIKFINKNAYIQTAIFSTPFCKSCRESFALIFRNASRVGAVTYVSAAVLIVGKLFISAVTTGIGYMIIVENLNDELFSVGGPVTVIYLISYWVSDFFMDIFDMGISTILHCFIADEEMFSGNQCFAQDGLKRYIDKYGADDGSN